MEIRKNIFLSILIHSMAIASVGVVGNGAGDMKFHAPASHITVSLLEDIGGKEIVNHSYKRENALVSHRDNDAIVSDREKADITELSINVIPIPDAAQGSQLSSAASSSEMQGEDISAGQQEAKGSSGDKTLEVSEGNSHTTESSPCYALIRAAIERAKIYPFLARKKRLEGTVITEFAINGKGFPEDIKVARSSGSEILDSAAVNIIKRAAPLPQIEGQIVIPITFSLTNTISSQ